MGEGYPFPCRRSFFRFIVETSATLISNSGLRKPVIVRNVCPRGACVFTNHRIEATEQVEIELIYLFDKPIYRKAKVIWSKEIDKDFWQAGLDFGVDNLIDFS
jgi:hypothetical protein